MTILVNDGLAYVDIGNGYCIHIGTEEEVKKASVMELAEMISRALAVRRFQSITKMTGKVH